MSSQPDHLFKMFSRLDNAKSNGFESSATVYDSEGSPSSRLGDSPVLIMQGLFCQSVGGPVIASQSNADKWCFSTVWKPDVGMLAASYLSPTPPLDMIDACIAANNLQTNALTYMAETLLSLAVDATPIVGHSQYFQWMKETVKQNMKTLWNGRIFQDCAENRLVRQIGENLPGILTGSIDPTKLMYDIYMREPPTVPDCAHQVQQTVELLIHKNPIARFLEIGAGRGECTRIVLKLLKNLPNNGVFCGNFDVTDPSAAHVDSLEANETADRVLFQQYDVDMDPKEQGLEIGCYDLIIASSWIYMARDLQQSMAYVRTLLKPGGRLLVWGPNLDRVENRMVFETLPSWGGKFHPFPSMFPFLCYL
jgi:SAM-dependent methyltransferase